MEPRAEGGSGQQGPGGRARPHGSRGPMAEAVVPALVAGSPAGREPLGLEKIQTQAGTIEWMSGKALDLTAVCLLEEQ